MPELPELHGMSNVINDHAAGRMYNKCSRSDVARWPQVTPPSPVFRISAKSRGKELMITLSPEGVSAPVYVLCGMGMTGYFEATEPGDPLNRHAHLRFHASDGSTLSLVDARRFGTWKILDAPTWAQERGPDPVKEYAAFRQNVFDTVASDPQRFEGKPICQVLHDQSLFNGIGNYLRAEILHRAGVAPFACARATLETCSREFVENDHDLLTFCHIVPQEVIDLKMTKYQGGKAAASTETQTEHLHWESWLRVYGKEDAAWAVDKDGRRIWYRGKPGALVTSFASQSSDGKAAAAKKAAAKKPAAQVSKKAIKGNATKVSMQMVKKRPAASTQKGSRKKPARRTS